MPNRLARLLAYVKLTLTLLVAITVCVLFQFNDASGCDTLLNLFGN